MMRKQTHILSLPDSGFQMLTAVLTQAIFVVLRRGIDIYRIITCLADTRRQLTVTSRTAMLGLFIPLFYLFFRKSISSFFFFS